MTALNNESFVPVSCSLTLKYPLTGHKQATTRSQLVHRFRLPTPLMHAPEIGRIYHALIRTHHITSRKKVAHLRKAAAQYDCYALLRSGGCPGIMYCKGSEEGVKEWVAAVHVCIF